MTEIKAFKGTFFNPDKISDYSKVVCPPYDVITKNQQNAYHNLSDYNFIRILLGKDKPADNKQDNKYIRAKKTFDQWLKDGILIDDNKPCIYYYKQEYKVMGERYTRLGFIALLKLQDEKESQIYPHEATHSHAKEDRLRLWRMLSSNLSPIFVCFSDREKKVEQIFQKDVVKNEPFIDVVDREGIKHQLWRLSDEPKIKEIVRSLSHQQFFIADGHHRYEVALEYRHSMQGRANTNGRTSFNYVMTYFTNMDSRDLRIFPMHRIIKHLPCEPQDWEFLQECFRIDKVKSKEDLMILLAKAGRNEHAIGLYTKRTVRLLRLKNKALIDKHCKEGSTDYRRLDASILKSFVFDRIGVATEEIIYTNDVKQATKAVDEGEAAACFIMNPVKIQQLKAIALNGERMPPKTTYFYPKVLSGLTVYRMG